MRALQRFSRTSVVLNGNIQGCYEKYCYCCSDRRFLLPSRDTSFLPRRATLVVKIEQRNGANGETFLRT